MVLKGPAKTEYMREYMRRRRAEQSSSPPKSPKAAAPESPPKAATKDGSAGVLKLELELIQARARIRALQQQLDQAQRSLDRKVKEVARAAAMDAKTYHAIVRHLHPDGKEITRANADGALKLLNAWKDASDKALRQIR